MKEITVYCPICKRKVGNHDKKSQINFVVKCKNCKKTVLYNVETEKTEIIANRTRNTSSGVTFY